MSSLLMSNNLGSGYNFTNAIGPNPGSGCNYAQLGSYNLGFRGIRPPVPMTSVSGYYVVPQYGGPSYSTLTHGEPGCGCGMGSGGNYFSIGRAYGAGAGNCSTAYMGSMCGGSDIDPEFIRMPCGGGGNGMLGSSYYYY